MRSIPILFLISACAITSGSQTGPNGRPIHYIDATSAGVAYDKAGAFCPNGYDIIGNPEQISIMDYVITVECR